MFNFDNINKVIDGKAMLDTTMICQLSTDIMQQVLDEAIKLNMSEKLVTTVKNLMSKAGIIKDIHGEQIAVNAICFFRSPVKGIGAMLNDPIFRIYELDVTGADILLTDYVAGGIITTSRDIAAYNKSRQFHKDDIMCIIPLNNHGWKEYIDADQCIFNMYPEKETDPVYNDPTDSDVSSHEESVE